MTSPATETASEIELEMTGKDPTINETDSEMAILDDTSEKQKILMFESNSNASSSTTKSPYQHNPNIISNILEFLRWKLNLLLQYKPFQFVSYINVPNYKFIQSIHQFIYRLTLIEIVFYIILMNLIIPAIEYFLKSLNDKPVFISYPDNKRPIIEPFAVRVLSQDEEPSETPSEFGGPTSLMFGIVIAFAARNTLWNLLFGFSFERSIMYHRILARWAIFHTFIHFWEYRNYSWFEGRCGSGMAAFICGVIMYLTSLNIVRRRLFETFYKFHWLSFIPFAIFSVMHGSGGTLIGCVVFVVDIAFRLYKMFCCKSVTVKNMILLPGNVIRIEFDKKGFKYDPGQYVFICIPAIGFTEYHPFSISSSPHQSDCVMIHIRVLGDWTLRLQKLIASKPKSGYDWNGLLCIMEGPYGELQVDINKYKSIVMVSGGIGITPLQSVFNELVHNISTVSSAEANLKRIHFVWTVRDPTMIDEFDGRHWAGIKYDEYFENAQDEDIDVEDKKERALPKYFSPDLLVVRNESEIIQKTEIITHFYITRVPDDDTKKDYMEKYPFLKFGRPSIEDIIKEAKDEYVKTEEPVCIKSLVDKGVAVLSCGPAGMLHDVKKYAAKYNIDCHTEIFDF